MAYRVVVTAAARNSLESSLSYISCAPCSPSAAWYLLVGFLSAVWSFESNPTLLPVSGEASKAVSRDVHWTSLGSYRLYIVVDNGPDVVTAFSFLHKRQNISVRIASDFAGVD